MIHSLCLLRELTCLQGQGTYALKDGISWLFEGTGEKRASPGMAGGRIWSQGTLGGKLGVKSRGKKTM